jgi:hypothetical protein
MNERIFSLVKNTSDTGDTCDNSDNRDTCDICDTFKTYLGTLSAKYPIMIPETVKTTTKVGPAKI